MWPEKSEYIPWWPLGKLDRDFPWRWAYIRKILNDERTHGGIDWMRVRAEERWSKRQQRRNRHRNKAQQ